MDQQKGSVQKLRISQQHLKLNQMKEATQLHKSSYQYQIKTQQLVKDLAKCSSEADEQQLIKSYEALCKRGIYREWREKAQRRHSNSEYYESRKKECKFARKFTDDIALL